MLLEKIKKNYKLIVVLMLMGFTIISCSRSDDDDFSGDNFGMTAVVDGTTRNFTAHTTVDTSSDGTVLLLIQGHMMTGVSNNHTHRIDLGMFKMDENFVGTYPIAPTSSLFGNYYLMSADGSSVVSVYRSGPNDPTSSGQLVIESYDGKTIKGKFEFKGVNDNGQVAVISQGTFNSQVTK